MKQTIMIRMSLHFLSTLLGVLSIFVLIQAQDQSGLVMNFSIVVLCHIVVVIDVRSGAVPRAVKRAISSH
jgi:hypothetical protein